MKSTFKVLFYLKKDKISKDGKVPVMGRITVNGTQAGFSCKLNIDPALWDEKTNYLKSQRNTLSREIHQMLENIKAQIAKHYQSISDRDAYVTANKVKNAYHGFGDRYKTLIAAFDYHADSIKARIGRDRAQRTYDRLMEERRCLMRYLVLKKLEDVTLKELDVTFIERYYAWMLSDGHCGKTTAFKRTQTLKCVLYVAVEQGWIDRHPFLAFKCAPDYKPRMFLSDEEIQRLMNIELRYHRQRAVRDMFIFCCFTGLAYIDLKNLTYDHIVTTPTGEQYIYNRRQKTGTPYHIMLLPIAQELIERYRGYPGKIDETRVFPVKDRKSMCTTIKRIAQKCGITKNLSTHIGRHTFGTTVTLEKGVPIETVSEMLGHKQITTTQIYAKLTANKMKEDVRLLTQRIGNLYELTQPTTRLLSQERRPDQSGRRSFTYSRAGSRGSFSSAPRRYRIRDRGFSRRASYRESLSYPARSATSVCTHGSVCKSHLRSDNAPDRSSAANVSWPFRSRAWFAPSNPSVP